MVEETNKGLLCWLVKVAEVFRAPLSGDLKVSVLRLKWDTTNFLGKFLALTTSVRVIYYIYKSGTRGGE
ncbi:MAG: hypothetical protein DRQ24_10175 [Candidatus Latescibacterota bacterium]|nr:MAG: hypothetical protein DRQ24_10175 [Candidatus Latescibacterota bacterium]